MNDELAMEHSRAAINAMIGRMPALAEKGRWTRDKLTRIYRKIVGPLPEGVSMNPGVALTYDHLFGFGRNARHYLDRREDKSKPRTAKLNPLTIRHIKCIRDSLKELALCPDAPPFGDEPHSWQPFLHHACSAVMDSASTQAYPAPDRSTKDVNVPLRHDTDDIEQYKRMIAAEIAAIRRDMATKSQVSRVEGIVAQIWAELNSSPEVHTPSSNERRVLPSFKSISPKPSHLIEAFPQFDEPYSREDDVVRLPS